MRLHLLEKLAALDQRTEEQISNDAQSRGVDSMTKELDQQENWNAVGDVSQMAGNGLGLAYGGSALINYGKAREAMRRVRGFGKKWKAGKGGFKRALIGGAIGLGAKAIGDAIKRWREGEANYVNRLRTERDVAKKNLQKRTAGGPPSPAPYTPPGPGATAASGSYQPNTAWYYGRQPQTGYYQQWQPQTGHQPPPRWRPRPSWWYNW